MARLALVVFSQTGITFRQGEVLSDILRIPLIRLEPQQPYTTADIDWHNDKCRANREMGDEYSRPGIKPLPLPEDFDLLFLGFPLWWGIAPRVVDTFVEASDLKHKKIALFATSGSSPADQSARDLQKLLPETKILDAQRVNGFSRKKLEEWAEKMISEADNEADRKGS